MIGIDISDRSVKVVQISNKQPRAILAHGWHSIPEGVINHGVIMKAAELKKVLRETLKECRIGLNSDDVVIASIAETQSFLRVIELPIMPEDELDEAVKWEVAQHIPFGLENVYIDWQPVGKGHVPAEGRREVLVGAAQRKVVDPLLATLQSMGLDVGALELESQAIVRALISEELRGHQGLLIVDLGGTATNAIIHDHGAMRFTASLQKGTADLVTLLPTEEARGLQGPGKKSLSLNLNEKVVDKLRSGQEELVMEIRGVVEFYNGIDEQHEVKEILLTGGGSNFPGLDRVFVRFFDNVYAVRGNPWVNVLVGNKKLRPPLSLQESMHFTTAIGLALRVIDG